VSAYGLGQRIAISNTEHAVIICDAATLANHYTKIELIRPSLDSNDGAAAFHRVRTGAYRSLGCSFGICIDRVLMDFGETAARAGLCCAVIECS
jgi:hypothetical protein